MAADKQQHAMTSLNNLALLLDEALQQMQQQMNARANRAAVNATSPAAAAAKGDKAEAWPR
jgi:ribosomal protein L12E/L44/L45/RPP1/RPP2